MEQVALLAVGAHPDDVELGMGATLAKHTANGIRAAICDLTEAELSSNGTVQTRRREGEEAARILGVKRYNLKYPDRGFQITDDYIRPLVALIRRLQPDVVFAPFWEDRHPDHVACSRLVTEAVFNAKIRKYRVNGDGPAHTVSQLYYYFINDTRKASFVVPVDNVYARKKEALMAYASQFVSGAGTVPTPVNATNYLPMIESRDRLWGQQVGCLYGEGFVSRNPLTVHLLRQAAREE